MICDSIPKFQSVAKAILFQFQNDRLNYSGVPHPKLHSSYAENRSAETVSTSTICNDDTSKNYSFQCQSPGGGGAGVFLK